MWNNPLLNHSIKYIAFPQLTFWQSLLCGATSLLSYLLMVPSSLPSSKTQLLIECCKLALLKAAVSLLAAPAIGNWDLPSNSAKESSAEKRIVWKRHASIPKSLAVEQSYNSTFPQTFSSSLTFFTFQSKCRQFQTSENDSWLAVGHPWHLQADPPWVFNPGHPIAHVPVETDRPKLTFQSLQTKASVSQLALYLSCSPGDRKIKLQGSLWLSSQQISVFIFFTA